jgi:uncharacterized protein
MLLVLAGLAGLVLPALPGPPLLFLGLLVAAWAEDFAHVGAGTLTALGVMAVLAFLADLAAGAFGARRYGASPRARGRRRARRRRGHIFRSAWPAARAVRRRRAGRMARPARPARRQPRRLGRDHRAWRIGIAAKLALGFAMVGLFLIVRFL